MLKDVELLTKNGTTSASTTKLFFSEILAYMNSVNDKNIEVKNQLSNTLSTLKNLEDASATVAASAEQLVKNS